MHFIFLTLVGLLPFIAMISFMVIWSKVNSLKSRIPFDYSKMQRTPAFSLISQHKNLTLDTFAYGCLANIYLLLPFAIMYFAGHFNFELTNNYWWIVGPMFCACVVIFLFKSLRSFCSMRTLRVGIEAEWAVASELAKISEVNVRVFHDVQCDNFNIDHVISSPFGIIAVETKGRKKPIKSEESKTHKLQVSGQHIIFPNYTDTKTIEQAQRQSKWLKDNLSSSTGMPIHVASLVVVPGWYVEIKSKPVVLVINHKNIAKCYRNVANQTLTQSELQRINHQLSILCQRGSDEF